MKATRIDTTRLFHRIVSAHRLSPTGLHGVVHWARVCENGLRLATDSGADPVVVQLFALFHDSCRENDGWDPDHGQRGAELARQWRGELFEIDDIRFDLLYAACAGHTDGGTSDHETIGTCWDADRLDLPRVGMPTDISYLSTDIARDPSVLNWATGRAAMNAVPDLLSSCWGFDE